MPKYNVEPPANTFECPHCGGYIEDKTLARHLAAKGGRKGDHRHKSPRYRCPACRMLAVEGQPCKVCERRAGRERAGQPPEVDLSRFPAAMKRYNDRIENPGLWEEEGEE